jgi:hypothetical protein
MTRSGTHRELSDRVDWPRLVRSTLSEMKGKAKPLPLHLGRSPPGFAYSFLREVLLNLKQGVETALARSGVPRELTATIALLLRNKSKESNKLTMTLRHYCRTRKRALNKLRHGPPCAT